MSARPTASAVKSRLDGSTIGYTSTSTRFVVMRITESACARLIEKTGTSMTRKFKPLTASELKEVHRRRAQARARARELVGTITDEEDAALIAAAEADPDNPPLTE